MSIAQVYELQCDCNPCPDEVHSTCPCGRAITDYADTFREIRALGAGQGWSVEVQDGCHIDYCPTCTVHRASSRRGVVR